MSSRELVLIGNFLPDRQESMLRFGQLIADGMQARGWTVKVWRPRPRFANLAGTYRYGGIPKYLGYLDKFFVFPRTIRRQARRGKPDTAYHIVDHSNAVYVRSLRGHHVLVTCHDLLQIRSALGEFPQHRVSRSGQKYQQWILDSLRAAPKIVCISRKTQKDLQRLTGLGLHPTLARDPGRGVGVRDLVATACELPAQLDLERVTGEVVDEDAHRGVAAAALQPSERLTSS